MKKERYHVFYYAVKIQENAHKDSDDSKVLHLAEQFEQVFRACMPPFEKAFKLTTDPAIK